MEEEKKPHRICMTQRSQLKLEGVKQVQSFDPKQVVLETEEGGLQIKGSKLHVSELSLESGCLDVEGRIDSLEYSDHGQEKRTTLLRRMFR